MVTLYLIENETLFYCTEFDDFDSVCKFAKKNNMVFGKDFYVSRNHELNGRKIEL